MSEKPTVSVIIPAYNRVHLVGRSIRSVLNQTYQDFELIVVDDGSTDNTEEVVKEFQKQDRRVKYIKHEKNKGASAARNTGIKNSLGYFLSFLDSDDQWLRNKLECDVKILNDNKDCVICSTGHTFIDEKTGKIVGKSIFNEQFVSQKIVLRGECIATNDFTAVKKVVLDIGGFDEKLPARQDWDFWIRITSVGLGVQVPINTVNKYVMHADQISAGLKNKLTGTITLLEKHKNLFSSDSLAYSKILNTIGLMFLLSNNSGEAVNYFKESYKYTQNRIKRAKLSIILATIKVFGDIGSKVITSYYKFKNPNSYLLW